MGLHEVKEIVEEIGANTNITELEEIIEDVRKEIIEDIDDNKRQLNTLKRKDNEVMAQIDDVKEIGDYNKIASDELILIGEENKNKLNEVKEKENEIKDKLNEVKEIGDYNKMASDELILIGEENKNKLNEVKEK